MQEALDVQEVLDGQERVRCAGGAGSGEVQELLDVQEGPEVREVLDVQEGLDVQGRQGTVGGRKDQRGIMCRTGKRCKACGKDRRCNMGVQNLQ